MHELTNISMIRRGYRKMMLSRNYRPAKWALTCVKDFMRNETLQIESLATHPASVKGENHAALKDSRADYWTETFGCSRDELQKALKKIGIMERSKQSGSRAIP